METSLLTYLSELTNAGLGTAAFACFIWGLLSIIISPCHLSSIPLIIGYLQSKGVKSYKNSFILSGVFSLGILLSLIIVGGITYSLGRLIGDIGEFGNILIIALFLLFGLYFLNIIKLDWSLFQIKQSEKSGLLSTLLLGFLFGIGLGPCTFAFMAPILGIVLSEANSGILAPSVYFSSFAIGHCLVIALAGALSEIVNRYLQWNESKGAIDIAKKICGVLMILAAFYMAYKAYL
jgi:cytochrome c-type biogenesis protein